MAGGESRESEFQSGKLSEILLKSTCSVGKRLPVDLRSNDIDEIADRKLGGRAIGIRSLPVFVNQIPKT
jgi:hypothetical protein